jgi:hypothetical protein
MSDHSEHDAHLVQIQRVLDRLEQVTKQAKDFQRMARELHQEAAESIRLLKDGLPLVIAEESAKPPGRRRTNRKRR